MLLIKRLPKQIKSIELYLPNKRHYKIISINYILNSLNLVNWLNKV